MRDIIYCGACGAANPGSNNFCNSCGQAIKTRLSGDPAPGTKAAPSGRPLNPSLPDPQPRRFSHLELTPLPRIGTASTPAESAARAAQRGRPGATSPVECPACGKMIEGGEEFCYHCGESARSDEDDPIEITPEMASTMLMTFGEPELAADESDSGEHDLEPEADDARDPKGSG